MKLHLHKFIKMGFTTSRNYQNYFKSHLVFSKYRLLHFLPGCKSALSITQCLHWPKTYVLQDQKDPVYQLLSVSIIGPSRRQLHLLTLNSSTSSDNNNNNQLIDTPFYIALNTDRTRSLRQGESFLINFDKTLLIRHFH